MNWNPVEVIHVPYLNHNIKRLECLSDFFCRYYTGGENDRKPISFAYFPKQLLFIKKYRIRKYR